MKKRISISTLIVIFISELLGFLGILHLKYWMNVQANLYDRTVVEVFEGETDVEQIRSLLYKYEYYMASVLNSSQKTQKETLKQLSETELELRHTMISHGELMKKMNHDSEIERLFRSVNDDVFNYLNYNVVLLSMKGSESNESINRFTEEFIFPLMERVNTSINRLSDLSKVYIAKSKVEMAFYRSKSRVFVILAFVLMGFSILVSIFYSYKVLTDLEIKNFLLKTKSEATEMKISEIQYNTIMGIADLVESRSGETGQHVKRTSHFVYLILSHAKKKGLWADKLTEKYIDYVTRAAPMHDIGKIVIPDAILNKPGKLTPEEFEIMKKHAEAGGKIVHNIIGGIEDEKYVSIASNIANYHHEKWNGKGYPTGKKGDEIPLSARIMAVADVFDALVSERCYKKPMSYEDAFKLIESESGEHFDPDVVKVFMELKDEIIKDW